MGREIDKLREENEMLEIMNNRLVRENVELRELLQKARGKSVEELRSQNHYEIIINNETVNTIEIIKATLGAEGFKAFCVGNALKYLLRAEKKNGAEDYKKTLVYAEYINENLEDDDNE